MAKKKGGIFNVQQVTHEDTIQALVDESSPRRSFLFMIIASSVVATLGLLNDSAAIVIGAMLVAPLLWPVIGISMGILLGDLRMIKLSLISILLSVLFAVVVAMLITFNYIPLGAETEILNQTRDFGFMLPVAIASGAAAAVAISFKALKEAISGIAVSVALIPPLVSIGIGLGGTDWHLMRTATEIFAMNLVGIIGTALLVFYLLGFRGYSKTLEKAVKKEEKVLKD